MNPRQPRFLLLALCLAGVAAQGCGSILRPRPLTAAQSSSLAGRAGSLGVVAVDGDACGAPGKPGELHAMLARTGLFREVLGCEPGAPPPDYIASVRARCSYRRRSPTSPAGWPRRGS